MDTKFIAMVGALVVLGGAVYFIATGDVLPGGDDAMEFGEDEDTPGTNDGTNDGTTGESDQNETELNDTEEVEEEETIPVGVECHVQEGDVEVEKVYSKAGPPFDARKAESMLHDAFNELREAQTPRDTDLLLCDPDVREIAQNHSEYMAEEGFFGEERPDGKTLKERYLDACTEVDIKDEWNVSISNGQVEINETLSEDEVDGNVSNITLNVNELYGRWLYQRNPGFGWDGPDLNQRVDVIQDHEDLVRDIRGVWVDNDIDKAISSTNKTRQGIGMHINRDTRLVHVTHAIC